jgi:P63C domain-containing protein
MESKHERGRSKGGIARAKVLTGEERSAIAQRAALKRWGEDLPDAICGSPERPLVIGGIAIEAYVLEDGTRVLTQGGFLEALGRHRKANVRNEGGEERFPPILQGKSIAPFIPDEVLEISQPVVFRTPSGNKASGYRAELLPMVCEIYLNARDAGVLPSNQLNVAVQADILVRGLAHVGIIALVDEVTGYQDLRARDALSRILEAFVAQELQPWVRTFPDDYYREMFRLRKLEFPKDPVYRPQYFGHLTNDIIYKRLAPGVLDELKKVTERADDGRPRHKYFQRLTSNLGYPALREHLGSVVTLMRVSKDWGSFYTALNRWHPPYGTTIPLPLDWGEDTGIGF